MPHSPQWQEEIRECDRTSLLADLNVLFNLSVIRELIRPHNVKLLELKLTSDILVPNLDSVQTRRAAATKVSVWSARARYYPRRD